MVRQECQGVNVNSQLLINGEWVNALSGETIDVLDPCTASAFGTIARGKSEDVDRAVKAARNALDGPWGRMTAVDRGRILQRLAR